MFLLIDSSHFLDIEVLVVHHQDPDKARQKQDRLDVKSPPPANIVEEHSTHAVAHYNSEWRRDQ